MSSSSLRTGDSSASKSASLARAAASTNAGSSSDRRASSAHCIRSCVFPRRPATTSCSRRFETTVMPPLGPRLTERIPSRRSTSVASRSTLRLTWNCAARFRSLGSRSPGSNRPPRIASASNGRKERWLRGDAGPCEEHAVGRRAFATEGTGSFGAGLTRFLTSRRERVLEAGRLRRERRTGGKTDALDAVRAARSVLATERPGTPRAGGERQALQALVAAREGAVNAKRAGLCQLRDLLTRHLSRFVRSCGR